MEIPKPGDIILVPDSNGGDMLASEYVGGYATISRVTETQPIDGKKIHYVTVIEHTGYKEYSWENFLEEMQNNLKKKYIRKERAYIKI